MTLQCNLNCLHCGSNASVSRDDELTLVEKIKLCNTFKQLGVQHVSLMGGEPFLSPDWYPVSSTLAKLNINQTIVTNGTLINKQLIMKLKEMPNVAVAISLDGCELIHNNLRNQKSAFETSLKAIKELRKANIPVSVITQITTTNISELSDLWQVLNGLDIYAWQVQTIVPMGRAGDKENLLPNETQLLTAIQKLLGLSNSKVGVGRIIIADNIGYMHPTVSNFATGSRIWRGCAAGINTLGIQSDGGIRACLSLQADCFLEGSVREKPLIDYWNDPGTFSWNRSPRTANGINCKDCEVWDRCKGGCSSLSYATTGVVGNCPICFKRVSIDNHNQSENHCNYCGGIIDSTFTYCDLCGIQRKAP